MARVLVLDPTKECADATYRAEVKELADYYKHLGCDCFDVTGRRIGGKVYDCYVDDIGLFREQPIISAILQHEDGTLEPTLVGNIIFANHDQMGNTISLSDDDIDNILRHIGMIHCSDGSTSTAVVCSYE